MVVLPSGVFVSGFRSSPPEKFALALTLVTVAFEAHSNFRLLLELCRSNAGSQIAQVVPR